MHTTEEGQRIGVSVLSQSEIVYVGLCAAITQHPDLVCCPHQAEGPTWPSQAVPPNADVVVAILTPDALWDVVQALNVTAPDVPVVGVIEAHTVSNEEVVHLVRAGITGLTTSMCAETIISIVRLAVRQVTMVDTTLMQAMMRHSERFPPFHAEGVGVADLSAPDRCLLAWIAHGYSNRQIAVELGTTVSGVKHRVSKVLKQLQVSSRILSVPLYVTYEHQGRAQSDLAPGPPTILPVTQAPPSDRTQDEGSPFCEQTGLLDGEHTETPGRETTRCHQSH